MTSLREAQERLAALLLGHEAVHPRVEIYRRNGRATYRKALAASFPVVRTLVGDAFFDGAVDDFVHACPSRSGDLNEFGGEFPRFLATYGPASALAYLPDVAALEWALDEAARAAPAGRAPAEVVEALQDMTSGQLAASRVRIHPAARLLSCRFGAMRIWQVHQSHWRGELDAETGPAPERLLVMRGEGGVFVERLVPAEHAWLVALATGAGFEQALHTALAVDGAFDLARALPGRIADGTLADVQAG